MYQNKSQVYLVLSEFILLFFCFWFFEPLLSFFMYFCFLHSTRHLLDEKNNLDLKFGELFFKTIPMTVITILFFTLIFLYSCGSAQEALVGKKRSEQGDEFLINKKNPLSMPPDFDKLTVPGEATIALTNENENEDDETQIKKLLNNNIETSDNSSDINQSSDIETSIIKKIQ